MKQTRLCVSLLASIGLAILLAMSGCDDEHHGGNNNGYNNGGGSGHQQQQNDNNRNGQRYDNDRHND